MEIQQEKFKEIMCDSCRYAEPEVVEVYRTVGQFSSKSYRVKQYRVWCNAKSSYVQRLMTLKEVRKRQCGYRPKSGKIGKHIEQKTLL